MTFSLLLFTLSGCGEPPEESTSSSSITSGTTTFTTGSTTTSTTDPLTERLQADEVRAGFITDGAALFGGTSAEGAVGDLKIYNDRVQFVIQAASASNYIAGQSGGVIDADLVRPIGAPGHDFVVEWMVMSGFGHLCQTDKIELLSEGADGKAVIRVTGHESPLSFITGALETPDFVPDWGLNYVTEYSLAPGSWFLEVTTTVTTTKGDIETQHGDILVSALEVGSNWGNPDDPSGTPGATIMANNNQAALGIFPTPGETLVPNPASEILTSLLEAVTGFTDSVTLKATESLTYSRLYGVGPDVSTLTDSWLTLSKVETQIVEGEVTAPDGMVAGARVTILTDDEPYSLALTDEEGHFEALVPKQGTPSAFADGRGTGYHFDLPLGSGSYSPYAEDVIRESSLDSIKNGADDGILSTAGRGCGSADDPLTLQTPGNLVVTSSDGAPFEVRVAFAEADVDVDDSLVQPRPNGYAALGWTPSGDLTIPLEPGTYAVLVHRGVRYELFTETVEITAGEQQSLLFEPDLVVETDGWLIADPHAHAAPSPDGGVTMSERLMIAAGVGIQLYFGTDHDHIVDFKPLLEPLGLSNVLGTVVSSEMSPVLRGHMNVYPLESDTTKRNGGAWIWFEADFDDSVEQFEQMREAYPDSLFQINHPMSGIAEYAGWSPGEIAHPDFWSDDFDVVEVLNGGSYQETFEFYTDLINRGVIATPSGVSDAHWHLSGDPGVNMTWLYTDTNEPTAVDDQTLISSIQDMGTVVSRGPFIELSTTPGSTIVGSIDLAATALSPSWIVVDTISLLEDGEVIETVKGTKATFALDPGADASYIVIAEGSTPMLPITSDTPWAMTAPIFIDIDGDGWTPPLDPLVMD